MKKVFTTGQVAKICKVAPRTVSKWFDSGRLRGYRIPGSQDRRIPREHLLRFLKEKYNGRVSFERVVAGMGLTSIYEFLREVRGMEEPAWLTEKFAAAGDPNSVITEMALSAKSEICEKALDMFVSAYGAEAGNLALKVLSVGGLYVGGGIAPRILEKLKDGTFMKAFTDKGRLSQLLINMPVRIILESRAALLGAAAYAEARAAEISGVSARAASIKAQ